MPDFDLLVIGAGAAGLSIAAGAAQLGVKTALVERERMGGDCLEYRLAASRAKRCSPPPIPQTRSATRAASAFECPPRRSTGTPSAPTFAAVIAAIAPNDSVSRFAGLGVTVLARGEARSCGGPGSVSVNGRTLTGERRFVIAAGSRAIGAANPGPRRNSALDQRQSFQPDGAAGPSAHPWRRPDRARNGRRLSPALDAG